MIASIESLKENLIEQVKKIAHAQLPLEQAGVTEKFIDHYYRNVLYDDMAGKDTQDLYGAAFSLLDFAKHRQANEIKIRLYNPSTAKDGWYSSHTVIEIINDNMPFLVDSITAELNRHNLTVHHISHPVLHCNRDENGVAQDFVLSRPTHPSNSSESFMHFEVDERTDKKDLQTIEAALHVILKDVRACVEDWPAMRQKINNMTENLAHKSLTGHKAKEIKEVTAFLNWLQADHFIFLGYREITYLGQGKKARLQIDSATGLGVLREENRQVFDGLRNLGTFPMAVQSAVKQPDIIRILKSNHRATVHRNVHLDTISVKKFNQAGSPVGEYLFVGLLTSSAYNQLPSEIPLLRQKVASVMENCDYDRADHNGKALQHVLDNYPRDELFQISTTMLKQIAHGIVNLQDRQRIAVFLRPDPFQRFISAFVYVPKDIFSTTLRQKLGQILAENLQGVIVANYTQMTEEVLARVHFFVKTTPGMVPEFDLRKIEAQMRESARSWRDHLRQNLIETLGEEKGLAAFRRFGDAFTAAYQEQFDMITASFDIACVTQALSRDNFTLNLYRPRHYQPHELRLKIYHPRQAVILSDILPMLENMGLKVMEEVPFEVKPVGYDFAVFIHDFYLVTADGQAVDLAESRTVFHDCFRSIYQGMVENDGFNGLVLRSGLMWRDVVLLRAYAKFLRQLGLTFSQNYMEATLIRHANLAKQLRDLFYIRFDPTYGQARSTDEKKLITNIQTQLDAIENLDEDRILRRFVNVIQHTLRTNFFQPDAIGQPKTSLAFKFSSDKLHDVPKPTPLREIFVYAPEFEAVHLRFGFVARGGLRWSDRREDFRTEILALVKAQQVKNAVIVPVGSKGGFVLKKTDDFENRQAHLQAGIACYQKFIAAMLDITDNLQGANVASPKNVVCYDGHDPYLVVAADKGTATFSDFANQIAVDHGFWLGDGFASGGSSGYDHKKMGITARGAWESVKRHFREIGRDIQAEAFSVIGVGDMSGDVFGNGMLLSAHTHLLGAFNHQHIFIDPSPDAKKSFKERQRLFTQPRSSWDDYNTALISKGGGIFHRKAKSIPLSPEMKILLGRKEDQLPPNAVIQALLKAKVDLLWFGGIGTYIKHSLESHMDAQDRANDAVRIDGKDLNCQIIGEGANLAVTQRGRIEFAEKGGRLNTDAIDNSAGVGCSDHEVNIKILLGGIVAKGKMTNDQRNQLLDEMTDEVATLVLVDNYQQTQSLSMSQAQATRDLSKHQQVMRAMERAGILDRNLEFLPNDDEIADRLKANKGLTRPELSVLLAYAKNILPDQILSSNLPDDPALKGILLAYFPKILQTRFLDYIQQHRLHREIIVTSLVNDMINRAGLTFMYDMQQRTGVTADTVARAYLIVCNVFNLETLWQQIEALDTIADADIQTAMVQETANTLNRMAEWFIQTEKHPLDITGNISRYKKGIEILSKDLENILGELALFDLQARTKRFHQKGVSAELASACGRLKVLSSVCDVVRLADIVALPVRDVAMTYSQLGTRFRFDWLRNSANRMSANSHWDRLALGTIVDDMWQLQYGLTLKILQHGRQDETMMAIWEEAHQERVERVDLILGELSAMPHLDLAMLAVINRELREMVNIA